MYTVVDRKVRLFIKGMIRMLPLIRNPVYCLGPLPHGQNIVAIKPLLAADQVS